MRFVFRMTVRELRASWRRLLFFFVCIAIGVASIVALRSVIQNVRRVLTSEARTLLAADIVISSRSPRTPALSRKIDLRAGQPAVLARTESIETSTMLRPADPSKLTDEEWKNHLFIRSNPRGTHFERWRHQHGCGRFFNAVRDTVSDRFTVTYKAGLPRPTQSELEEARS